MKKKLTKLRAAYLAGLAQIDRDIAEAEAKVAALKNDRIATLGGVQCIDALLNSEKPSK